MINKIKFFFDKNLFKDYYSLKINLFLFSIIFFLRLLNKLSYYKLIKHFSLTILRDLFHSLKICKYFILK